MSNSERNTVSDSREGRDVLGEFDVAKKNTDGTTPAPRRAAPRRASAKRDDPLTRPPDRAGVTRAGVIDTASDMATASAAGGDQPAYDDIAQAAYQRYLDRGGSDGGDFDDWIQAERELARRNGH
jgi:hypothetical protein